MTTKRGTLFLFLTFLAANPWAYAQTDCSATFNPGILGTVPAVYEGSAPAPIGEVEPPSGGTPDVGYEFMWLYTPFEPGGVVDIWYAMDDETHATYQPPILDETTWYRRCARQAGCVNYVTETVEVRVEVLPCDPELRLAVETLDQGCAEVADGKIFTTPLGSHGPFQIAWADGSTAWTRTDLAPGGYVCTLTDANGCTYTETIRLAAPAPLAATLHADTLDCFDPHGTLRADARGGTAPYAYAWFDATGKPFGNDNYLHAAPGTYRVHITDANGCNFETTQTLVRACGSIALTARSAPEGFFLEWAPTLERANTLYYLERGPDTLRARTLSDAIPGYGHADSAYGFHDADPPVGVLWYRVRNLDAEGRVRFSNWVSVDDERHQMPHLFPNPVTNLLTVDLLRPQEDPLHYRIFDQMGCLVLEDRTRPADRFVNVSTDTFVDGNYRLVLDERGQRARVFAFAVVR